MALALAAAPLVTPAADKASPAAQATARPQLDSQQLESALQRLTWSQFSSVIVAIPKLKADIDAYGPAGWQFVKAKYPTHKWRKNIDRLDDAERRRLADLIRAASTPAAASR